MKKHTLGTAGAVIVGALIVLTGGAWFARIVVELGVSSPAHIVALVVSVIISTFGAVVLQVGLRGKHEKCPTCESFVPGGRL